uniref:Tr-type G domain-containing protein n=1 Tax=Arcella intermedia TaxID=1963864 RepID=A0A6B2KYN1_9EUKA
MLYYSNSIRRVGDVDRGDTVMDYLELERKRGITITSAAISFPWKNHTVNVIDTPGHVDFTVEVERSVRVLDGAVTILDAYHHVQAQTTTVWNQATNYNVPRIIYVNKMDREGASFNGALASIENKFGTKTFPIQLPIGSSRSFSSIVDLLHMETIDWNDEDFGFDYTRSPVTGINQVRAQEARNALVEKIAEHDDKVMELCLSDVGLNVPAIELRKALRRISIGMKGVVVMCGSSLKNKGVQPVLDGIIDYLPSPIERPPVEGVDKSGQVSQIYPESEFELCALAFKVIHDHKKGMIVYLRVYSGCLTKGIKIFNTAVGKEERPIRICRVRADDYEDIDEVKVGDIAAAIGLKFTRTGDTLVGLKDKQIALKGIKIPEPVFFCSVVPESPAQEEALNTALTSLQSEDPSIKVHTNTETGQLLLSGMGELHLEIVQDRLLNHYKVKADIGKIYLAYRSTIMDTIKEDFRKTFTTSRQESVFLTLRLKRNSEPNNHFSIVVDLSQKTNGNKKAASDLTQAFTAGADDAFSNGIPSGFPFHDISVELLNMEYDKGTSIQTYRIAMVQGILQLAKKATPLVLEPVMDVEIICDDSHTRTVLSDLTGRRRGSISLLSQDKASKIIQAKIPLKELLGYSSELRSFTKGTGFFSMEFSSYEPTPLKVQDQILKEHGHFEYLSQTPEE